MAMLLYSVCFLLLISSTAAYVLRHHWLHLIPLPEDVFPQYIYSHLPSTFQSDIENGFTSSAFDLSGNMMEGDSRGGLDLQGKREVQRIMRQRRVGFDEARRMYIEKRFAKNNIGADGLPNDPKFVSFS